MAICGLQFLPFAAAAMEPAARPPVRLARIPDGGIQPQATVDRAGNVRLVYLKEGGGGWDVFSTRQAAGSDSWSAPLRVNSKPGSAIATGTIRGAQIALGRRDRVHVAWNGSGNATGHAGAPMLYARLNDAGDAFEPERDLIHRTAGLDGGGSVAADEQGNVYVVWHAQPNAQSEGEANRRVFIAISSDDGRSFDGEVEAPIPTAGVCGCCGLRAFANTRGDLLILYRAARAMVNRDEVLLVSRNHGSTFEVLKTDPWITGACPMSSAGFSQGPRDTLAVWETNGRIHFSRVDSASLKASPALAPGSRENARHPSVAGNSRGQTIVAWTEGTGWMKGSAVAWETFDTAGKSGARGRADGVPVWGLVAAVALPDGGFEVIY
jgi:hypothetical protein